MPLPLFLGQPAIDHTRDGELARRRGLDRAIGRALVDGEYAAFLLNYPMVALGTPDYAPWAGLEGIRTWSLQDFASQAATLFGPWRAPSILPSA